ncbi:MAG: hypothetical protein J4400_04030 [Candidatus Aenigmarchaeota archaeon]|nr:hypothetical protein [Candidatus Aenigmarchaeota archaeon]
MKKTQRPFTYEVTLISRDRDDNLRLPEFPDYVADHGITYRKVADTVIHAHGMTKRLAVYKPHGI